MRPKTMLALLLAACLLCGLMAGCSGGSSEATQAPAETSAAEPTENSSGEETAAPTESGEASIYPLCEETEYFTWWMPISSSEVACPLFDDFSERYVFTYMAELTNVELEFISPNEDMAQESLGITLASNEYPDVIAYFPMYYTGTLEGAIDEGIILELSDLVAENMPNYTETIASSDVISKAVYTDGGEMAALYCIKDPQQDAFVGPMIRGDLLDKYDLETPTTYSELENVLTTFVSNGEGGLGLTSTGFLDIFGNSYALSAGYDIGNTTNPFLNIDGEAVYTPITDGWRSYLEMLASWNEAGLIYADWSSLSIVDLETPAVNGDITVFDGMYIFIDQYPASAAEEGFTLEPLSLPKQTADQEIHLRQESEYVLSTRGTVITTSCEDPALIMSYIDYWYSDEGRILVSYGQEGVSWEYDADGNPQYSDYVLNNEAYDFGTIISYYRALNLPSRMDWTGENIVYSDAALAACNVWSENDTDYLYPSAVSMTADETADYNDIMRDISTYVEEYVVRVINGDDDLDATWDEYVQRIESLGIAEATALRQQALDRYLSR